MKQNNDLRSLDLSGFQDNITEFDSNIFSDNQTLNLVRSIIRKYLTKSNSVYKYTSSYGLKHIIERHIGTYVSNGELIYAMHLEGFNIIRDGSINCFFNIKKGEIKLLAESKEVLETLSKSLNYDIFYYLKYYKRFLKYKYHFKYLIHHNFCIGNRLNRYVIKIIAKEIHEDTKVIQYWFELSINDKEIIPNEKMKLLESLFKMSSINLTNNYSVGPI